MSTNHGQSFVNLLGAWTFNGNHVYFLGTHIHSNSDVYNEWSLKQVWIAKSCFIQYPLFASEGPQATNARDIGYTAMP